jgi:cell division septum initiation protein DivIVA
VVLASGAATGDSISIVSFGTFSLADHYNKTQVDAFIDDVETLALAGI